MNLPTKYSVLTTALLDLGYTLFKGYPTFGTPQFKPPYMAVVYATSQKPPSSRVGNQRESDDFFRLFIVATNEVELLTMVDNFQDWLTNNRRITDDNNNSTLLTSTGMTREFDYAEQDLENYVVSVTIAMS